MSSSSTSRRNFRALDPLRRYCNGLDYKAGPFPTGYWKTPSVYTKDSRCGFCSTILLDQSTLKPISDNIVNKSEWNCESAKDRKMFTVDYKDFEVSLQRLNNVKIPLYLVPDQAKKANESGVGIFYAPTQCEYQILIRQKDLCNSKYFKVKAKVGDKDVTVQDCFYRQDLYLKGFVPGTGSSFKFYSPEEQEIANLSPEIKTDLNKSNIIHLVLQAYDRIPKKPVRAQNHETWSFGVKRGSNNNDRGGGGGGSGFSFGSNTNANNSGGMTLTGDSFVPKLTTSTTEDKFVKVGDEIPITLQLVCFQSDKMKMVDNMRALLHKEGYDYYKQEVQEQQRKVQKLEADLKEARVNLEKKDHNLDCIVWKYASQISTLGLENLCSNPECPPVKPVGKNLEQQFNQQDQLLMEF